MSTDRQIIQVTKDEGAPYEQRYTAVVYLPRSVKWPSGSGVCGQATAEGAFVKTCSTTYAGAIRNAMVAIGEAVMLIADPASTITEKPDASA